MRSKYRRGLDMVDKWQSKFVNIGLLLLVIAAAVLVPGASATPSYASQTGKLCDYCHVDPNGGGTLTAAGDAFKANGYEIPTTPTPKVLSIVVPSDITKVSTGTNTVVTLGKATSNGGTAPVSITNDAPSAGFPIGTTTVTWTATDILGATATGTQKVTITDIISVPPEPTIPGQLTIMAPANIAVVATGILTNIADLGVPTITGGAPPYTTINDAPLGGNFAVGDTIVTWTVNDSVNATANATQKVTVTDIVTEPTTGGTISGKVFRDSDHDTELDDSEHGMKNVRVSIKGLDENNKQVKLKTYSTSKGYAFSDLPDGTYSVHVSYREGFVHTTKVTQEATIINGETVTIDFGKMKKKHVDENKPSKQGSQNKQSKQDSENKKD